MALDIIYDNTSSRRCCSRSSSSSSSSNSVVEKEDVPITPNTPNTPNTHSALYEKDAMLSTMNTLITDAYKQTKTRVKVGLKTDTGTDVDVDINSSNSQYNGGSEHNHDKRTTDPTTAPPTSWLDVTQLHRQHVDNPIHWPGDMLDEHCTADRLGHGGYGDYMFVKKHMKQAPGPAPSGYKNRPVRIFCSIFTIDSYIDELQGILHTWGRQCDGFLAFSNSTGIHTVHSDSDHNPQHTPNPNTPNTQSIDIHTRGGESYSNMWVKTQDILRYIRRSVWFDDFDYYVMGGDDLLMNIPNLRVFLSGVDRKMHTMRLYMGRTVRASYNLHYNTGGAGYILNKAAITVLTNNFNSNNSNNRNSDSKNSHHDNSNPSHNPDCFLHERMSVEDVLLGLCLAAHGIYPLDTTDTTGTKDSLIINDRVINTNPDRDPNPGPGVERFHWHTPLTEHNHQHRLSLYHQYSINPQYGLYCCSAYSISYHYIDNPLLMQCMYHAWEGNSV